MTYTHINNRHMFGTIDLNHGDVIDVKLDNQTARTCPVKQITNGSLKQMIMDHLFQKFGIKMTCTNKYFRPFDPATDMTTLRNYKHLVYINTNQRVWLLCLVTFMGDSGGPVCLLIDKQNTNFYLLKCQFSPSLYQGTILEGEVVDGYFLISDFLVYLQKNIAQHPLDKRITLLNSILGPKNYQYDSLLDPFQIAVKDFVDYTSLLSFIHDYVPTLPYSKKINGVIFRPIEASNKNLICNFNHFNLAHAIPTQAQPEPSQPLTHPQSSQTPTQLPRPQTQPTQTPLQSQMAKSPVFDLTNFQINVSKHKEVKFLLFETGNPDDYRLKLLDPQGQLYDYDYVLINDLKTSQYFQKVLSQTPEPVKATGICVRCGYNSVFKKWRPIEVIEGGQPDMMTTLVS